MSKGFRMALVQLAVGPDKRANLARAACKIKEARELGADLIALPECFNSPYGTKYFNEYAESIPDGPTCQMLSLAAKENNVYIVGGTIPEKSAPNALFNTSTVWSPTGDLLTTYRKMHLFDIDIPGRITFKESDVLSAGNNLGMFTINSFKVGLGICYDLRFEELSRIYRNLGCGLLIYPGAFNMTTGPLHWELLQRSRANDCQAYVAGISPARDDKADYVAWGHSQITNPYGKVLASATEKDEIVIAEIDPKECETVRQNIPIFTQRRLDIYQTELLKK